MRLVSWNVAHAARERPLHPGLLSAIAALEPDVLALNEYVHGPSRDSFVAGLAELGLPHVLLSKRISGHNQVLVASRQHLTPGDLAGPSRPDSHAASNLLHVLVGDLEVIAVRAPSYVRRPVLRAYWESLHAILAAARARRMLVLGDFNADPDLDHHLGTRYLRDLEASGWSIPRPSGDWSCWTRADLRSRIDHALASSSLTVASARYVLGDAGSWEVGNRPGAVSDHAPLMLEISDALQR